MYFNHGQIGFSAAGCENVFVRYLNFHFLLLVFICLSDKSILSNVGNKDEYTDPKKTDQNSSLPCGSSCSVIF